MQLRTRKDNESTDLLGQVQMVVKRALAITGVIEIWYLSFLERAKHVQGWNGGLAEKWPLIVLNLMGGK